MPKEIEIEIGKNGKVKIHIKGIKGPKCMDYAKLFEDIISGEIEEAEHTWEYHETTNESEIIDIDY